MPEIYANEKSAENERNSSHSETETETKNGLSKFFLDAYQDGSDFLEEHPLASAGLAVGLTALALRFGRGACLSRTRVIPALPGDAVITQKSGLRGLLGIWHESPVIPNGMSVEAIATKKMFGLVELTTYDLRSLKPIAPEASTRVGSLMSGRRLYGPGAPCIGKLEVYTGGPSRVMGTAPR